MGSESIPEGYDGPKYKPAGDEERPAGILRPGWEYVAPEKSKHEENGAHKGFFINKKKDIWSWEAPVWPLPYPWVQHFRGNNDKWFTKKTENWFRGSCHKRKNVDWRGSLHEMWICYQDISGTKYPKLNEYRQNNDYPYDLGKNDKCYFDQTMKGEHSKLIFNRGREW